MIDQKKINYKPKNIIIETTQVPPISAFVKMVDKLRTKSEDELKMLCIKLFSGELLDGWKDITADINSDNMNDEKIITAIQRNRYKN